MVRQGLSVMVWIELRCCIEVVVVKNPRLVKAEGWVVCQQRRLLLRGLGRLLNLHEAVHPGLLELEARAVRVAHLAVDQDD
jgi:hypothetical protein